MFVGAMRTVDLLSYNVCMVNRSKIELKDFEGRRGKDEDE